MGSRLTAQLGLVLALFFLATAEIAVRVAYDPVEARSRFWFLVAGLLVMVVVMLIGHRWGTSVLGPIALGAAALAAALGLYWILTYDWVAQGLDKFALLQQIGLWIQRNRPVIPVWDDIHSNPAGGALAVLIPLGLGGVVWVWQTRRSWLWTLLGAVALLGAGAVLVLTMSRGAWIGLGVGLVVFGYLVWRTENRPRILTFVGDVALLSLPIVLVVGFWLAVTFPGLDAYLGTVSGGESAMGRVALWRQGLDLVQDYPFTGAGLNSPMMALSSYVMLLHVGFIVFVHNMFLEIAVEQGIPALLSFLSLLLLALSSLSGALRRGVNALTAGAGAAIAALCVHGMLDSHGYYTKFVVLTFLLLGFALGLDGAVGKRRRHRRRGSGDSQTESEGMSTEVTSSRSKNRNTLLSVGGAIVLGLLLLTLFHPTARSYFQSNLGAVAQTQAELSVYAWPQWPIQDELRRSVTIDLTPAIARYQAALALDPANPAANRRLGQMQLSLGQYEEAQVYLNAAYASAPQQQATRQLLAETEAIAGDIDSAAALLRTVDTAQGQWPIRIWWHDHVGEPEIVQRLKDVETLASSPTK